MSNVGKFLKKEFLELLPTVIFFFVAFHILALSRSLMLRKYGIEVSAFAGATVAALVVAKVVLIADVLPIMNRFPRKPLIYNVVWKAMIYLLVAFVVHLMEHLIPLWWHAGSLTTATRQLLDEIVWPHFWAIQLWLLVLFLTYCTQREMIRVIGPAEVKRLFFGITPKSVAR